jgi:protease YdgD
VILNRSVLVVCVATVLFACLLLLAASLQAGPLSSGELPEELPGGLPDGYPESRLRVDSSQLPWRTIGQLNMAGRGSCTATLVAADWVVTAAHCLWNGEAKRWYPAEYVHFVAGFEGDDFQAHSVAKRLYISPDFQPEIPASLQGAINDWALIQLRRPLGRDVGFLAGKAQSFTTINLSGVEPEWIQAGYRFDRSYVLTVHRQCQIQRLAPLQDGRSGLIGHRCDTTSGDSGGPLLYHVDGQYYLVGVYIGRVDKTNLGLVVSISQWRDWLVRFEDATLAP